MERIKKPLRWWRNCVRTLNRRQRYLGLVVHFTVTATLTFLALIVSNFLFISSTVVYGPSMEPTLQKNDRLLVYKSSSLLHKIVASDYVPERGSIVVIKDRRSKLLIKRLVGLPGEKLVINEQKITIYNSEFPDGFQPKFDFPLHENLRPAEKYELRINHGQVFVLGDNGQFSTDSRDFGTLPTTNIVGILVLRFWPLQTFTFF